MSETLAPVLGEATVQELRDALRGELLQPGDELYDEAKRLWNGAHDGSEPAMVARCTGAADVIAALGFARANDLEVAVRGAGGGRAPQGPERAAPPTPGGRASPPGAGGSPRGGAGGGLWGKSAPA